MKRLIGSKANERENRAQRLKAAVCELLKWREEQYADFVWQCGTRYLQAYLKGDEHSVKQLEYNRVFWTWWKNHWANRDEDFLLLNKHRPVDNIDIRVQLYEHYNDGVQLARSIHPNSVVLNDSYASMMDELVADEVMKHKTQTA